MTYDITTHTLTLTWVDAPLAWLIENFFTCTVVAALTVAISFPLIMLLRKPLE